MNSTNQKGTSDMSSTAQSRRTAGESLARLPRATTSPRSWCQDTAESALFSLAVIDGCES
jgi:hypothetical protein